MWCGPKASEADIPLAHRDLAAKMLFKFWPDDNELIEAALRRASRDFNSHWEYDIAISYVMSAGVDRADVRAWLLDELGKEHASFSMIRHGEVWSDIGVLQRPTLRSEKQQTPIGLEHAHRLAFLHMLRHYVVRVADPKVAEPPF